MSTTATASPRKRNARAMTKAKGKGKGKVNRTTTNKTEETKDKKNKTTRGKASSPKQERRGSSKSLGSPKPPDKPERPEGTTGKNFVRDIDPVTGYVVGSDADVVAKLLIEGDTTRQDITDRIKNGETPIETKTRNGNDKPISNLVSTVYRKLIGDGFTLDSHYRLVPPKDEKKTSSTKNNAKASGKRKKTKK